MSQDHLSQEHGASAAEAMARFHRAFVAAADHNRALAENFTARLQEESARFFNLRLDRSRQAMEQLQDCRGVPGLLGVQQNWMSELMQDCAEQGRRYSDLLSQSLNRIQEAAGDQADSVTDAVQPVMEEAQEVAQQDEVYTENLPHDLPAAPQEEVSYDQNFGQPHIH